MSRFPNKDVRGAAFWIAVLSLMIAAVWLLTGCYGFQVNGEFEHHSSIPQQHDDATTDQYGVCVEYPLGEQRYATLMEVCAHDEIGGGSVFGEDPVGTVRIKQPIYKSR